jgi:hypothetical protein
LIATGLLGERQLEAWQALHSWGPMTGRELDDQTGQRGLWRRLSELKALGLVKERTVRTCRIGKRAAIVWEAVMATPVDPANRARPSTFWLAVTAMGEVVAANGGREFVEKVARQRGAELVKVRELKRIPIK